MNYQIVFQIFIALCVIGAIAHRTRAFIRARRTSGSLPRTLVMAGGVLYVGGLLVAIDRLTYADLALGFIVVLLSNIAFELIAYEVGRYAKPRTADAWHHSSQH